jgi:Niemann-Pick C1 protein
MVVRSLTMCRSESGGACTGGHLCCSGKQAEIMQKSLQMAEPFIWGCPACAHNFRNLFCSLFCSPDQATFANVTAVQQARPAPTHQPLIPFDGLRSTMYNKTVTAVKEVEFFLSESFANSTYDSCKDVVFGSANTRAMLFIGGGATSSQVRCSSSKPLTVSNN